MENRAGRNSLSAPIAIYEVHLGSWMRVPEEDNRCLSYREAAHKLADYVREMGSTHVEFLPLSEYPPDDSWGYQTLGYFAPTSRFGTPQDFMYLIDTLHQRGIGVIMDWVPARFSGFGPGPVRNFLISNALFWFEKYHLDGLRVAAVTSLLRPGGKDNPEAIDILQLLNSTVYAQFPGVMMIADESVGFGFKWNVGWTHDVLEYMSKDPVDRFRHRDRITFSLTYAFSENFVLPFSHDEVVYGKGSMIGKMPGDNWRKFANLRLLYGFLTAHPGKKLLFMGNEFGQWKEWNSGESLDWALLDFDTHKGLKRWVRDLVTLYRAEPALHELDADPAGFEWIDRDDSRRSILSFRRKSPRPEDTLLFVCNFTPEPRSNYRAGVPENCEWSEILNGDAPLYGGSGQGNLGGASPAPVPMHGHPYSLNLTLPPLAMIAFKKRM